MRIFANDFIVVNWCNMTQIADHYRTLLNAYSCFAFLTSSSSSCWTLAIGAHSGYIADSPAAGWAADADDAFPATTTPFVTGDTFLNLDDSIFRRSCVR